MAGRVTIYVFRGLSGYGSTRDVVVSAAPAEAVVALYGGGGLKQSGGLSAAFGGAAIYRRGWPFRGEYHLGVWGDRKASRFRESFRKAGMEVEIINSRPPGWLFAWLTRKPETSPKT